MKNYTSIEWEKVRILDTITDIIFDLSMRIEELSDTVDQLENKVEHLENENEVLELKIWSLNNLRKLDSINSDQNKINSDLKIGEVRDQIRELKLNSKNKGLLAWFK